MVYKICREEDGKYYSAFTPELIRCEYKLKEWTYPEIGMLFVFDTLENVRWTYLSNMDSCVVFECKAKNILPSKRDILYVVHNKKELEMYWKQDIYQDICNKSAIPVGTLLCDAVYPVKVVR